MTESYIKDYPRPQFVRDSWETLNGRWDFAFDDAGEGESEKWFELFPSAQTIQVPFSYESNLSGIGETKFHPVVWYQKEVNVAKKAKQRVCIHFEGSDYLTKLWVNGKYAGSHVGGYTRFTFDVTELLRNGLNQFTVRVEDSNDMQQPRGKQRWVKESFACWYVQTTGIWKTVWLEYVPETHLENVKMTPLLGEKALDLEWKAVGQFEPELTLQTEIRFQGKLINRVRVPVLEQRGKMRINMFSSCIYQWWGIKTWSPEEPNLYDIRFELFENDVPVDRVNSYFGMRDIHIQNGNVLLNGQPLYQRLILNQGYWKDSQLTPPDEETLINDVESILALGYNGVRMHQKLEDERFCYWCDVNGLLMWCEMPSAYNYGDDAVQDFTTQWMEAVRQYYNHPSTIVWTPFNESWGIPQVGSDPTQQHFTEAVYHLTKSFDPMRPVIVQDGWEHTVSDIITIHDYEGSAEKLLQRYLGRKDEIMKDEVCCPGIRPVMAKGFAYRGQPVMISECGGIAFADQQSSTWGYGDDADSSEAYLSRFEEVTSAIKAIPYICGYCYTQVSDVQQEVNGILDDSHAAKVDKEAVRKINLQDRNNI